MKHLVYAIRNPTTLEVRYIGKSCKGRNRPQEHFSPSHLKRKCKKSSWILSLLNNGAQPETIVLEICEKEVLDEREVYWIFFYRKLGHRLTNMTNGGTGGNTGGAYKKHKPVTAIEISTGKKKFFSYIWETEKEGFQPSKVVSVCKKRRISHRGYYFYYTGEEFQIPIKKTMKPIVCKCKKTGREIMFTSIAQAAKATGYCITSISNIIRGKQKGRKYEFINASHVNERYEPVNKPIRIEL